MTGFFTRTTCSMAGVAMMALAGEHLVVETDALKLNTRMRMNVAPASGVVYPHLDAGKLDTIHIVPQGQRSTTASAAGSASDASEAQSDEESFYYSDEESDGAGDGYDSGKEAMFKFIKTGKVPDSEHPVLEERRFANPMHRRAHQSQTPQREATVGEPSSSLQAGSEDDSDSSKNSLLAAAARLSLQEAQRHSSSESERTISPESKKRIEQYEKYLKNERLKDTLAKSTRDLMIGVQAQAARNGNPVPPLPRRDGNHNLLKKREGLLSNIGCGLGGCGLM